jgi:hypothetical protein
VPSVEREPSPRDALFERPAWALYRHRGVATAMPDVDDLCSTVPFRIRSSSTLVHAPVASGARFSGSRRRSPTSATVKRRAGTPYEPSILAREWDCRPAARRHQPMPVASVPRCVTASRTREPRSRTRRLAHTAFPKFRPRSGCAGDVPSCVDERQDRGPRRSREGRSTLWTTSCVPSSLAPRAPVSPARPSGSLECSTS